MVSSINTARERDLATCKALEKHDTETHRKGETLSEDQKVYRAKVVLAFMAAGIPLSKLDCPALRELLEENKFRLTHSRHMMDLVPFVLQECSRTRSEVQGKYASIIFDGTTRLMSYVMLRTEKSISALYMSIFFTEKLECRGVSLTDNQFALCCTWC